VDAAAPALPLSFEDAGAAPDAFASDAGVSEKSTRVVFAGDYSGSDRAIVRMPGQPEQTQNDPKARITIAERDANTVAITLIDSSNGSTICTLLAKTQKDRADVSPGQACFGTASPEVRSNVKNGTATVAGARLRFDMFIELEFEMEGQQEAGAIDYHFEGTRR
jgi:hypothetical protein